MKTFDFASSEIPDEFFWFNEPPQYYIKQGLHIITGPQTDFWQGTHYGFRSDNGHCLLTNIQGDLTIETCVEFQPKTKYDQCGLIARIDSHNWIKCSVELEDNKISRLGSVVTNLGYSDWATQDISSDVTNMYYRLSKRGQDYLIESSYEGIHWHQMRITHLHELRDHINVGVYACSPVGENFPCTFRYIELGENKWHHEKS
jgi:regulation of enolase protein 1 (concanavalin A-like superfamily)